MRGKSNETVELNKNHQNRLSCVGLTARLIGKTSSLKAWTALACAFSDKAAVGSRPPTQDKQKTEIFVQASAIELAHIAERSRKYAKSKAYTLLLQQKSKYPLFSVFCLRRLKRAGTDRSRRD